MLNFSLIGIVSYGLMLVLSGLALAHRFEARSLAKQLNPALAELLRARDFIRGGGDPDAALAMARHATEGLPLAPVFARGVDCGDPRLLIDQIDEEIDTLLGGLSESCELNEALGPRFGLVFSVVGTFLVMATATPQSIPLAGIGIAMGNTAMGMGVGIIEAATITKHIAPFAKRLSQVSTGILNEVCHSRKIHPEKYEIANAA